MTKDWQRLADAVVRRRAELGRITQAELAHRAGISLDRIQAIEGAKSDRYRRVTLMALERALEWEIGSIDAVLSDGEPVARPDAASELREPNGPDKRPSNIELAHQLREQIAELRAAMDAKFGPENKQVRQVLLDGLEAIVEESSTNRADR